MVEAAFERKSSKGSSSSVVSDINFPFIIRMLLLMELPPCSSIEEGIETVQRAVHEGIYTKEQLDAFVHQVFHEVHGGSDMNNCDMGSIDSKSARLKAVKLELASQSIAPKFGSQVVKDANKITDDNYRPALSDSQRVSNASIFRLMSGDMSALNYEEEKK